MTSRLEWTLTWGWAPRVGLFVLALSVLVLAWLNVRHVTATGQRATLLALRGALIVSLLIVSLQPTWVREHERDRERVVAVVIDESRSMATQHRRERACGLAETLLARPHMQLFGAGERLRRLTAVSEVKSDADHTDLIASLRSLAERTDPSTLAAVVLISDGIDPALKNGLTARAREVLAMLAVPVHTLALPDEAPLIDVAVTAVRASPFAFARNRLPVEVDIALDGLAHHRGSITVHAALDGVPVTSQQLALAGPRRRTLTLEVQPKTLGDHVLTVAATALPEEVTHVNNRVHQPLHVVRDRVRVLHLAGHPSYDTRFLRAHLSADPAVDLISFYIMVGRGGGLFVQPDETTLIPFPTAQLFGPALADFDLIVFSDFEFARFDIERFMPQLRQWVAGGGAFAVFGGPDALTAGGYARSSIARWLPVRLDAAHRQHAWRTGDYQPTRTDVGRHHAITRLSDDRATDDALWRQLHLEGLNHGGVARAGAAVLLLGPEQTPLLTVSELGAGRMAVVGTDSLWTWAFPDEETPNRDAVRAAYQRLIGRLTGWLLRDPAFAPMQLSLATPTPRPGDDVTVDVRLASMNQRPAAGVTVRLRAAALPRTTPTPATGGATAVLATAITDSRGRAKLPWRPPHGGPWQLTVSADGHGTQGRGRLAVAVAEGQAEDIDIHATAERLAALSAATAGETGVRAPQHIATAPGRGPVLREQERTVLWSSPWSALALLTLLVAEWVLRRRWGLA